MDTLIVELGTSCSTAQWSSVTPIESTNQWQREAQQAIARLARLPVNWDGYGSLPIKQPAIERAADLVTLLARFSIMPRPQIFPVSGGGLQLEFQRVNRELELEVMPDGSIEYLTVNEIGYMREGSITSPDAKEVVILAHWLQGK